MERPSFVEPPVFSYAQGCVAFPLPQYVLPASALGSYLHDEVAGLTLYGDDVAIVVFVRLGVGVEGDG